MRVLRSLLVLPSLLVALPATLGAQAPPARTAAAPATPGLLRRAAESMGGESALRSLTHVSTRFIATTFGIGQEETWSSPPRATVLYGSLVVDHARARRLLVQETRPAATASGTNRVRQVLTTDFGVTETNGAMTPMGAAAVAGARRAMDVQPERLVLYAIDNPAKVRSVAPRVWREESLNGVRILVGTDSLSLYFDRTTGRPTLMVVLTDDPVLGDRSTETAYTRWVSAGAVVLPRQVDVYANGRQLSTTVVYESSGNAALDEAEFMVADSVAVRARAAAAAAAAPVTVTLVPFGTGVWRAEGGSHHSLVVEQGTGLLVIEAPQSAERTRAVLDTLARRFPGRAVRQVVSTHHHYDHSGGVREYMARGVPVLTHQRNVAFVTRVATARKTVAPDALSRGGARPAVQGMADSLVIGSGASAVVLYSIGSVHAEGLLAAFVPSAGVLFTSDVLNPAPVLNPVGAAELVAFARARGLAVRTYTGGHGVALPWADVERAVAR